jgi:serine/threonine protein kinase/formylglycine-generating enzyme required for sulfatase activity
MKTCPKCDKTYEDDRLVCADDVTPLVSRNAGPTELMPGKLIANHFLLVEKIGQGGMGAVYKAIHTEMGRICAIKVLTSMGADDEAAQSRFKREAQMASRIDNSHVVIIYDFGRMEGGMAYLAMEYIDGQSLSKFAATEGPVGVERVVHIARQIAEALGAAHALGIVHRDLKPDNIMVTQKAGQADYVKVLDFGIAKADADDSADNITQAGSVFGTPVYMSPEQLAGEKLDARSDVYSFALIVYELLGGRLPFEGENWRSISIKRLTDDPIPLRQIAPDVSSEIETAVMAGLARDRDARVPTAEQFVLGLSAGSLTRRYGSDSPAKGRTIEGKPYRAATVSEAAASVVPVEHERPEEPENRGSPVVDELAQAYFPPSVCANQEEEEALPPPGRYERIESEPQTAVEARGAGKRIWWIAGGSLLFAALALSLILVFAGNRKFTIVVRDAIAGSDIYVDGIRQGVAGDDGALKLADIKVGPHFVLVSHAGYADFETSVSGKGGDIRVVLAQSVAIDSGKDITAAPAQIDYNGPMILIAAGEFVMGDDNRDTNEKPAHKVTLPAYYVDKFEVTNEQYKRFCTDTGHQYPPNPHWDEEYFNKNLDSPVVGVSWSDAQAYAAWARKRLPTEEEWEKAASWDPSGHNKRVWPWGDSRDSSRILLQKDHPSPVGSQPLGASAYGVEDMAANVSEWVDSYYQPYPGNQSRDEDYGRKNRVVRGGNFRKSTIDDARTTVRYGVSPVFTPVQNVERNWLIGFRCAVSVDDPRLQDFLRSGVSSR